MGNEAERLDALIVSLIYQVQDWLDLYRLGPPDKPVIVEAPARA